MVSIGQLNSFFGYFWAKYYLVFTNSFVSDRSFLSTHNLNFEISYQYPITQTYFKFLNRHKFLIHIKIFKIEKAFTLQSCARTFLDWKWLSTYLKVVESMKNYKNQKLNVTGKQWWPAKINVKYLETALLA